MRAVLDRLDRLDHPDALVRRSGGLRRAFVSAVVDAEVALVDAALLGELVDDRLGGKRGVGRARRAVGRGLGPVDDHVVGVDQDVGDVVGRHDTHRAHRHRRARKAARLVRHPDLGRDDLAVLGRAHLAADSAAGGRAARAQDLGAVHRQLHRMAGLLREQHRQRLEINRGLAAEAATDLGRHDADFALGNPEHRGAQRAHHEAALGRAIDGGVAVGVVNSDRVVRLDIPLMHHRGLEAALDHEVGLAEAVFDVTALELDMGGDVGLLVGAVFLVAERRQQDRRARRHRVLDRHHRRQHLVVNLDEAQRLLGDMRAGRGDGGDRMAVVEHLAAREDVARQMMQVDRKLAALLDSVGQLGKVGRRHNRLYPGQLERLVGLDRFDDRVGVRAAEHPAKKHSRKRVVGSVPGRSGHLLDAVVTDRTRSDNPELMFLLSSLPCSAISLYQNCFSAGRRFQSCPPRASGRLGCACLGGFEHRVDDLVVAGASAKIARQCVANLGLGRMRVVIEQRLGRHQKARRANAALQARVLEELLLQRMQLGAAARGPRRSRSCGLRPRRRASGTSRRRGRRPSRCRRRSRRSGILPCCRSFPARRAGPRAGSGAARTGIPSVHR